MSTPRSALFPLLSTDFVFTMVESKGVFMSLTTSQLFILDVIGMFVVHLSLWWNGIGLSQMILFSLRHDSAVPVTFATLSLAPMTVSVPLDSPDDDELAISSSLGPSKCVIHPVLESVSYPRKVVMSRSYLPADPDLPWRTLPLVCIAMSSIAVDSSCLWDCVFQAVTLPLRPVLSQPPKLRS